MGSIRQRFDSDVLQFRAATPFPTYGKADGTHFPVTGLSYDGTTAQYAYLRTRAVNYGTGNLTITLGWYAATATSGGVTWEIALAAITPNTDTTDVETKAFAAATTINDTHLGTTGKRAHDVVVTISNLDGLASDDWLVIRVGRLPADAGDNMTGNAILTMVDVSYSDT